jgi:hypothetical protein
MRFSAELTGAEQVPPVNTSATGQADFQYNEGSRQIFLQAKYEKHSESLCSSHSPREGEG